MRLKRKRALEVPPKIRCFINCVTAVPLENIQEPLNNFVWEFDKGDFHHWADLFNHFDSFFEKYVKPRKDLQVDDGFLDSDPPFPKEAVLQILRVIRIILDNCPNKHFYSSYEQHLSLLLASTDPDVVEATLDTFATFLKKTVGKYSIRDTFLNSKLFALAQGWGGKEEGLGLIASVLPNGCDPIVHEMGCALHFEFYSVNESESDIKGAEPLVEGLQIIHLSDVNKCVETDLGLLHKLVTEYEVPSSLRFSLLTRLRFARAFGSLGSRQQYTCIRLYAFIILIQACGDADDLASFFNAEPEFINELVSLLSYEDAVLEKIRVLCLHSLAALCHDRSRQPSVLTAVTSGGHRGILSSLMQKSIDSVIHNTSNWSVHFAEALLSLVTVLVSSSSGCSAMREAGFIPTLLPLLKDTNPQHLLLVEKAVRILEAFMDYSNPAAALFRDLGGLDDTISRLKIEVSHVENGGEQPDENSKSSRSVHMVGDSSVLLNDMQPLYSEPLISYHRKLLIKALLRAISLGTYAPGNTARIYESEDNVLPQCLCIIFRRAKYFGGGVFSLAATVLSDLIQKDPTCFPVLDAAGLPSAFLDAIMDDVLYSSEAITCIPQCLDALCLNSNGLQAVKDRNSLRCFVKVFTSRTYLRALTGDTPASLSSGLDELMRHASSLRGPGVDMLVEILETISKIGSPVDPSSLCPDPCSSNSVPMEMDGGDKNVILPDNKESLKADDPELINEESYLPDCVNNVARLLETILQNADTCRIFVEKKGIEAILQLFTLPLMPPVSVGQSISVAFKNFSQQHYASLARALCSFLREHLKSTNELLYSVGGTQLALVEPTKQTKVLKCISSLEGVLALSVFLLKGTTAVASELSTSDADVLKDIGRTYKEIIWQISLCNDSKTGEKKNNDQEHDVSQAPSSTVVERESDDDTNMQTIRYTNPVFGRTGSRSLWSGGRDFVSVVRSEEGLHRRTRQGIARMRGGRTARRLEALNIDFESSSSALEASLSQDLKKKSPDVLALEILNKLASTMRSFFTALVKGFTTPNRRRADSGSLSSASKSLGTVLATNFLEALSFSGHSTYIGLETSLSVKCRYLGKVVDDMASLTFDSRRKSCYTAMVNNFYVHGTFKELLTTFEATSQLLWTLPCSITSSEIDLGKIRGAKLSHNTWLLDTLQSYCHLLEYFVNSSLLLSPTSASQAELLVQPVTVGLSIGLFPVPRDPKVFVCTLQSQVQDVILPVWNHPMFCSCSPGFIASIISLVTHVYSGVGDVKQNRNNIMGSTNQRFMPPPPDEATISTIVEMGFSRARAEEALRRVETNSVEMAMEWLFSHADDPIQEDDELAQALALSLGSSSETTKVDSAEKTIDVPVEEGHIKKPLVDDILAASAKLFQSSDLVAFKLTDLLVTLCNQNKGEVRPKVISYLLQQLKLCPLDFSVDNCALGVLAHIIALLLFEDGSAREIASQNGIISITIDILTNLKDSLKLRKEISVSKCISALLLILDQMLQSRPKIENVRRFTSPIDESSDTLADFNITEEENGFFFGLATAPAHVEDRLDDAWIQFAEQESVAGAEQKVDALMGSATADGESQQAISSAQRGLKGNKKSLKVAMEAMIRGFEKYMEVDGQEGEEEHIPNVTAWHNVPHPEERLRFWSDPDTELKLAKDTGVTVFRMGIDWSRVMPHEPVNSLKESVNYAALERYKWIINRVRSYGMKVMLTLFHHSLPPWAGDYGGWKLEKTVDYFMDFTRLVVDSVSDLVDYWVTFNEPHVFCMLTYCSGTWPGGHPDMLEAATSALPTGVFQQAMHWISVAHSKAYDYIHELSNSSNQIVGVAHHVSFMRPYGLFDIAAVSLANSLSLFPFIDEISKKMDFIGVNYYGQEAISGAGLKLVENDEYSESGRGVYPDGLYRMLLQFHERYKHLNVPFIIAENGIADETDLIRRPYLLEHLLAVYAAMIEGVPVLGYLFWTISDNWEWADGYGPKFGLVAVDRANNLARIPRPSYHLFSKVVSTGKVTHDDRDNAWNELQRAAKEKKTRPFYRAVDKNGLMLAGGLDEPIQRPYIERDWRFGHYEMDDLQDYLSQFSRFIIQRFSLKRKKKSQKEQLVLHPL